MSDLSDLHGIYPTSLRWNAESGFLAISVFNAETGERELQPIELGQTATFVLDLATRERGYGLIKSGVYDMKLSPVGSPPPPWPENEEYKPALGCWMWNPTFGELRLETNATLFRDAIANVWDKCRFEPQAAEKLQPVICFADRVSKLVKQVAKTFYTPVIKIVGWIERDKFRSGGSANRLSCRPRPCRSYPRRRLRLRRRLQFKKPAKAKRAAAKPGPGDPLADLNDDIPWK